MALAQAGAGDADEARLLLHLLDGGAAGIAHRLAQAADQLVDQRPQHAFVGHARLDALGDEAALIDYAALEVAVLAVAALLHGPDRAHRPVVLEALPVGDDQFAGALVDARQQATQHDGVCTGSDDRHIILAGNAGAVIDSGYLRHANARYDARCTYRSRANACLYGVRARLDKRLGCLGGSDVSGNQLHTLPEAIFDARHGLDDHVRVSV